MFIMPKHVFYDLSYATTMSNMIKEMTKNVQQLVINLMIHDINFNNIAFTNWLKMFIMSKHIFYNLSYATIMSNTIKEITNNGFSN
jgi:hypothetical protein